jgi:hypothetical protein
MSKIVQITRGTAALPPDIEKQFARAQGREMTAEERRFFGLPQHKRKRERVAVELEYGSKAA